jgi:hypothetical protein
MEVLEPVHGARRASALAPRARVCRSRLWPSRIPRLSRRVPRATASRTRLWVSPPLSRVVRNADASKPRSPHASVGPTPVGLRDRTGERRSRRARARAAESRARHKWSGLEQVPLVLLHDEDEDCRQSSTRVLRQPDRHRRDGGQKRPTSATNSVVPAIRPRRAAGHAEHSEPEPPKARSRPAPARDLPPQGPGWCAHDVARRSRTPYAQSYR